MISPDQIKLIGMARAQAGLNDDEYLECWRVVTGIDDLASSKDERITMTHFVRWLGYVEAIYWKCVDEKRIKHTYKHYSPFKSRSYWATRAATEGSRQIAYAAGGIGGDIKRLEMALQCAGKPQEYLAAIKAKTKNAWAYRAALERTVKHLPQGNTPSFLPTDKPVKVFKL